MSDEDEDDDDIPMLTPEQQYDYELGLENEWYEFLIRSRDHFIDEYSMHHHTLAAGLKRAAEDTTAIHNFELDVEAGYIDEDDFDDEEEDELEDWQK